MMSRLQHIEPNVLSVFPLPRTGPLPDASKLLEYDIVLATHERLTAEDQRGGFGKTHAYRA